MDAFVFVTGSRRPEHTWSWHVEGKKGKMQGVLPNWQCHSSGRSPHGDLVCSTYYGCATDSNRHNVMYDRL